MIATERKMMGVYMLEISMFALASMTQILVGLTNLQGTEKNYVYDYEELYCLATNAYHEARGEGFDDKLATSQVVMNRVDSLDYPKTACDVITEGPVVESWKTRKDPSLTDLERKYYPKRNRCQFSWYCDGKSDHIYNMEGWEDSVIASYLAHTGYGEDIVGGATHYYAHKVTTPSWAKDMRVTAKLNGHTYLKEKNNKK